MSTPEVLGRSSTDTCGEGLGLLLAVAGGPRMFTPADLIITSSTDAGASTTVVLKPSCASCGWLTDEDVRLNIGDDASGVTGDDSLGVRAGEFE